MGRTSLLTDLLRLVRKFLDLLLRQNPQDDNTIHTLLKPLLSALESFRVYKLAVNASPAGADRNIFALHRVLVWSNPFADGLRIFGEFLGGLAENAFQRRRLIFAGYDDLNALTGRIRIELINRLGLFN